MQLNSMPRVADLDTIDEASDDARSTFGCEMSLLLAHCLLLLRDIDKRMLLPPLERSDK